MTLTRKSTFTPCGLRWVSFVGMRALGTDWAQEWYGWHFPEMAKIIVDNIAYAKVIRLMGKFCLAHPVYSSF